MLVKELLQCMCCTQSASVFIYEGGEERINHLFDAKTKGHPKDLSIPEGVLNREVKYYCMDHSINTRKKNKGYYEDLPYIELELIFNICVKEESNIDYSRNKRREEFAKKIYEFIGW